MAGNNHNTQQRVSEASPELHSLRALAQANLAQIELETVAEASQHVAAQLELQRFAKVRRKDQRNPASTPQETKSARLRSASDVLDRLRHDPSFNLAEYRIGYLERFEGLKEMSARSWINETTDEDWIPQHRIKYVKHVNTDGEHDIVWDREAKIDKIFGSGNAV